MEREAYFRVESLAEYRVVATDRVKVARYYRTLEGVPTFRFYGDLADVLESERLGLRVPLAEFYRKLFEGAA